MGLSAEQIVEELYEHNDFFDMIVDMIPSKLYIAGQSGDDYNPKNRYHKGVGAQTKQARKAAAKAAKRQKLDPSQAETTVEKKKRLDSNNDEAAATVLSPKTNTPAAAATPSSSSTAKTTTTATSPHKSRIEALRAKLHAKIAEMQGQRPQDPNQVSKRAARRAEKRKRQEEAAKRKKHAATKVSSGNDSNTKKNYQLVKNNADTDPSQDLATLDFGKLAGLNAGTKSNYLENNKALANMSKTKNLQKMLADAEAKRKKLEELKKGSEEEKAKAQAIQWADTLKEADGHRIKDDPAKLKKALKKKAVKKAKSQQAWKSRMDQVKEKMDERQKIRQHNLAKRKEGGSVGANLSRKAIKTADTNKEDEGRKLSRPGFEGRKQDFLNTPKNKGSKSQVQ